MPVSCSSLYDVLRDAARQRPRATAVTFLDHRLAERTYSAGDLHATAEDLATRLEACAIDPRTPVGILAESQECQLLHYLAVLASGRVPAILTPPSRKFDRAYYLETMRGVLAQCGFGALITDLDALAPVSRVLRPFTFEETRSTGTAGGGDVRGAAFLQFSSGTTGIKRGVLVSARAALAEIDTYARAIDLTPADRILSWLPLYHDMGFIAALNMPLACGVPVIMMQPLDWVANPGLYLRAASRYRATIGWHPNFAFAFMAERVTDADLAGVDVTSIRALVNASEPVTRDSQDRFLDRFAPYGIRPDVFYGCYGMAEMTFALTHGACTDPGYFDETGPLDESARGHRRPFVSVGRPIAGVDIRIVDASGATLGDRRVGEIWARSPFLFMGYHNNPAATAEVLQGEWYRSGDLAYRVGQEIFICGRKKDLLIINGINVYPQDVEHIVSTTDSVQSGRVVAFAIFDEPLQSDRMVILAEPASAAGNPEEWLLAARRRVASALQLSAFEIHVVPPGWLIKSSAGKIARGANKQKWLTR